MIHIYPDGFFGDHSGVEASAAKMKAAKLASKIQVDLGPLKPTSEFAPFDTNGDGIITAEDCPFTPGSDNAALWWKNVQMPYIKATISHPDGLPYLEKYGDKFHGFYKGKPLLTGVSAEDVPGQGDFKFVADRLVVVQGMTKGGAQNVAGMIKAKLGR